jgi:hypothetical protein
VATEEAPAIDQERGVQARTAELRRFGGYPTYEKVRIIQGASEKYGSVAGNRGDARGLEFGNFAGAMGG